MFDINSYINDKISARMKESAFYSNILNITIFLFFVTYGVGVVELSDHLGLTLFFVSTGIFLIGYLLFQLWSYYRRRDWKFLYSKKILPVCFAVLFGNLFILLASVYSEWNEDFTDIVLYAIGLTLGAFVVYLYLNAMPRKKYRRLSELDLDMISKVASSLVYKNNLHKLLLDANIRSIKDDNSSILEIHLRKSPDHEGIHPVIVYKYEDVGQALEYYYSKLGYNDVKAARDAFYDVEQKLSVLLRDVRDYSFEEGEDLISWPACHHNKKYKTLNGIIYFAIDEPQETNTQKMLFDDIVSKLKV